MHHLNMLARRNGSDVLAKLSEDLSSIVPGTEVCVLTRDALTGSFHGLCNRSTCRTVDFLAVDDPSLRDLLNGNARVFREADPAAGVVNCRTVMFPISVRDHVQHVVAACRDSLSDSDMRLIEGYCKQTSIALETLEMQKSLNAKIERLSSLVGVVDDLSLEQNYRSLLQTVLDRSADLLRAEQGSILLLEEETDILLLRACKGAFDEASEQVRVPKGVGIAGRVAERGESILVEDIEHDPRVGKRSRARYKTSSFVSVPLKIGHRIVGVMNFADKASGEFFDDVDLQLAQTCASHAAIVLDRKRMCEETERLKQEAMTDHLTGMMNRGCILNRLREELLRSERFSKTMSLVMLDIDGFKNVNDVLGHAAGDRVLQKISKAMTGAVRSIDVIGRYGGDEFIIILPETDAFFAVNIAERLRADIACADLGDATSGHLETKLTASIGIATYPSHGTSPEVLVDHADEALYRAKNAGRDRVVVY